MALRIVINNQARLERIGIGYMPDAHDVEILQLKPGVNVVDCDEWERAKALETIRDRLDADLLEEGDEVEDEKSALGEMDERAARKLVGKTYSVPTLAAWQSIEERAPIRKAIKAQIEKCTGDGNTPEAMVAHQAADVAPRLEPAVRTSKPRRKK